MTGSSSNGRTDAVGDRSSLASSVRTLDSRCWICVQLKQAAGEGVFSQIISSYCEIIRFNEHKHRNVYTKMNRKITTIRNEMKSIEKKKQPQ